MLFLVTFDGDREETYKDWDKGLKRLRLVSYSPP